LTGTVKLLIKYELSVDVTYIVGVPTIVEVITAPLSGVKIQLISTKPNTNEGGTVSLPEALTEIFPKLGLKLPLTTVLDIITG
jgi:hypothetical protein